MSSFLSVYISACVYACTAICKCACTLKIVHRDSRKESNPRSQGINAFARNCRHTFLIFLFSFFPLTTFPILFENGLRERLHSIFAWLVRFPLCSLFVFTIRGNICTVYRSNPNQIYVSCDVILQSEIPRRGKYLFQWNNNVMFVPFICKQLLISRVCLERFFFFSSYMFYTLIIF